MVSLVLQTAVGLTFIFATFAAAVSAISETAARYLGLRNEYLLRGIRTAVDGPSTFRLRVADIMPRPMGRPKKKATAENRPGSDDHSDDDEAMVTLIINHPLVASSANEGVPPHQAGNRAMTNKQRRSLPSYLSGKTFARALIDILVVQLNVGANTDAKDRGANDHGAKDHGANDHGAKDHRAGDGELAHGNPGHRHARQLDALRHWAGSDEPPHKHLADVLRPLLAAAHDLKELETSVAGWYEEQMSRVSGWYKRHVRWISLGIGAVLVVAFNVNAIKIADALYSDQALSTSVVAEATRASSCHTSNPATCLADLRSEVGKLRGTGLPIGWGTVPACAMRPSCSWLDRHGFTSIDQTGSGDVWAFLLVLFGWAVMILALLPGARFWFDLLSKFGTLRSTGPKPAT